MPQAIEPFALRDRVQGVIHENIVDDYKVPPNAVNDAVNVHFDVMGAVKTRPGLTLVGAQVLDNNAIQGMHQFLDEGAGSNDRLVVAVSTFVKALVTGTWTNKRTGLTAGATRFTNFLDTIWMVNGTDALAIWDGGAGDFVTTGNAANGPVAKYIDNYRSRVWAANVAAEPSRLYYTTVASSTGTVTWDTTNQFIDVSPGDGEDITGILRSPRALLVFKPRHTYRIFSITDADPDPQINVGTYSQESVVETKAGIFFHDWQNSAIHVYNGGAPDEISRPIKPYLEGVSLANRTKVSGWADDDHVSWSVGDVELNGVTISNCVLRYTVSTKVWTIYSYPTQFLAGATYDDGSNLFRVVGDDDGNVFKVDTGNDDNGTPITFSVTDHWHDISGQRARLDTIGQIAALHRNAEGSNLQYQTSKSIGESDWMNVGQLTSSPVDVFDTTIEANRVRFRLSGTSSGEPMIYQGLEILGATAGDII